MREYAFADFAGDPSGAVQQWRPYASRRSAERYAKAHGLTLVDSRRAGQQMPRVNDAQGWDRLRSGR